jgi:hypothetical protein
MKPFRSSGDPRRTDGLWQWLHNQTRQTAVHTANENHDSTLGRLGVRPGPYAAQDAVP